MLRNMARGKLKSGIKHKNNKGKRWKKGHSSESNPGIKKHRESAKNKFFNVNTGPSGLTVEAIAKHDASNNNEDMVSDDAVSDVHSSGAVSAKTFNTWASNWTDCTNATFGKVHRYWASNSALHKEVLAVLAAVTEIIKEQGGAESETDYFAALMTTLDTIEEEQSLTAVTYLLGMVIKRVPAPVLKTKFSEVSKSLTEQLESHTNTDSPALLRSLLVCLSQLLRVQEQAVWSNASTIHVYNTLLKFIAHPKPKVRKAAQHAVRVVLKASTFMLAEHAPPCHPAAPATAKYCIHLIEDSGGSSESSGTFYSLGLLQYILGHFPQNSLKSACETILRVMTLANVIVTSVAMKALHGMFMSQPKSSCLSAELNAQIITALYDYQPGDNDSQPMSAWLAVMEAAHINLRRLNEQLCISHLPRLFGSCMKCLQSEKQDICQMAAKSLQSLLQKCVGPSSEFLESMYKLAPKNSSSPIHKMVACVSLGLGYQYHAAWNLVLQVIRCFMEVLGKQCAPLMKKCLQSMSELRDSHKFAYKAELDTAVGMAVRTMGPRTVLEAIPLCVTGEEENFDFPHSWLLPVLRDNIRQTELAHFTTYFLPLAAKLRTKSIEYAKQNRVVESKTYDALQSQMWSLLPAFCNQPTDLVTSFKGVAKILGSALTDRPDLKMDILASIRKLIAHSLENETNKAELSKFAKNFLPLLFNLYTTEEEGNKDSSRLAVLETIKTYLQIAPKEVTFSFFDRCSSKLQEDDIATFRRHALMDLSIAMVNHVDSSRITSLYSLVTTHLQSSDKTVQKKSYRILEEVCCSSGSQCTKFVQKHLKQLQTLLLKALSSSSPSSKAPRLRCLVHIFKQLKEPQLLFMTAVVPEAILCTKEVAEKARSAAYNLLVEMGKAVGRWSAGGATIMAESEDPIQSYFELVLAGLAGSPHMVTCTVLALTRILYEFKDSIKTSLLTVLVESICLLLKSKTRQIVDTSLGLLKVLLTVFSETTLAQHIQQLVSSLVSMKDDSKHHFRFKSKEIFARIIKKFGFEVIHGMVPVSHHKVLNNIRKTSDRNKRKKKEVKDSEEREDEETLGARHQIESIDDLLHDSDSELDEDEGDKKGNKKKHPSKKGDKKRGAAWIKEQGDDIVDFMDFNVSSKVLATKPESGDAKKPNVKHDFKMAPDGRLIISDGGDTKADKVGKRKTEEDDDIDDLLNALEGGSKPSSRKRKVAVEDLADKDHMSSASSYRPGGHGIHRPLGAKIGAKKTKTWETGDTAGHYRAKKAGGDVKKTGKHDPYTYIPLDRTSLNRRKQAKSKGQFKSFVRGAKKGALKGSKLKSKKHKAT